MTAKELLVKRAPTLSEEQAAAALQAADLEASSSIEQAEMEMLPAEMASTPESWGWHTTAWGTTMPNVVNWVDQDRLGR